MENNYVLNHDYGYGKEVEEPIIKLKLRNFEDLKTYIKDILNNTFVAEVVGNTLTFKTGKQEKIEVVLEKVE